MNHRTELDTTAAWCGTSRSIILLAMVLSAVVPGCADKDGRQAVTGTATYQGVPLADGNILFRPLGDGQVAGAKVEQGDFHIPRDQGLLPGKYRVEIKAMRDVGKPYVDSESGQEEQDREQFLPSRYNTRTKLTIEVTAGGENTFSWELGAK